jgi:RNA polymerase sigma factor (sigma-70 family)
MAVIARDARAHRGFERMYRRHVPSVYRYALAVLGNEADAEDAAQQTFLSAYRSWERGERPKRTHNWLITIAHNVCRQRFRERSRRPAEVDLTEDAFPSPADDQALGAAEIRSALEQLAFNQRAALVMRELGGSSYRDIASSLGVSEAAVETLLFRARRALREQLEGDLTCGEAEAALSRRLDGMLPRSEAGGLRAHLRACGECATLERSMRARRAALRGLAFPLPPTLAWGPGPAGGSAAAGAGLLAKGAAVVAVGALAAGVGTKALDHSRPVTPAVASAAATATPGKLSQPVQPATSTRPRSTQRVAARSSTRSQKARPARVARPHTARTPVRTEPASSAGSAKASLVAAAASAVPAQPALVAAPARSVAAKATRLAAFAVSPVARMVAGSVVDLDPSDLLDPVVANPVLETPPPVALPAVPPVSVPATPALPTVTVELKKPPLP